MVRNLHPLAPLFFSISLLMLFSSCRSKEKPKSTEVSVIDVIIQGGKVDVELGDELFSSDLRFENVDSFRVETDKILYGVISSEMQYFKDIHLVPGMAVKRDSNGVEKVYISTNRGKEEVASLYKDFDYQLKVRDRWFDGFGIGYYHYWTLESFYDRCLDCKLRSNSLGNGSASNFEKRHQMQNLHHTGLVNIINNHFYFLDVFKSHSNPMLSELKTFELGLRLDSMFIVGVERELLCVQVYGAWELYNKYKDKLFSFPIQSYATTDLYKQAEFFITDYELADGGKVISEALMSSLNQLLLSKEFRMQINSAERIRKEDSVRNSDLGQIQLLGKGPSQRRTIDDNMLASVHITRNGNFGSGSVISSNGYILTNYHVINPVQENTEVLFADGNRVTAEIVRYDRYLDVALLKVDTSGLITTSIATSSSVSLGDEIYTIATPLHSALMNSVLFGRVSALRETGICQHIQSDGSWHSGCSGGPVFNNQGQQIGLHVWGWKNDKTSVEGINFAIPIGEALERLNLRY